MAKYLGIYECAVCGNIVEVLYAGVGELNCCGQPMIEVQENVKDAVIEKHVPVGERQGTDLIIKVGSTPHPMTEEHYIQWVDLTVGSKVYREFLRPGQEPQVCFSIGAVDQPIVLRAYCNLHGFWKG